MSSKNSPWRLYLASIAIGLVLGQVVQMKYGSILNTKLINPIFEYVTSKPGTMCGQILSKYKHNFTYKGREYSEQVVLFSDRDEMMIIVGGAAENLKDNKVYRIGYRRSRISEDQYYLRDVQEVPVCSASSPPSRVAAI